MVTGLIQGAHAFRNHVEIARGCLTLTRRQALIVSATLVSLFVIVWCPTYLRLTSQLVEYQTTLQELKDRSYARFKQIWDELLSQGLPVETVQQMIFGIADQDSTYVFWRNAAVHYQSSTDESRLRRDLDVCKTRGLQGVLLVATVSAALYLLARPGSRK